MSSRVTLWWFSNSGNGCKFSNGRKFSNGLKRYLGSSALRMFYLRFAMIDIPNLRSTRNGRTHVVTLGEPLHVGKEPDIFV